MEYRARSRFTLIVTGIFPMFKLVYSPILLCSPIIVVCSVYAMVRESKIKSTTHQYFYNYFDC